MEMLEDNLINDEAKKAIYYQLSQQEQKQGQNMPKIIKRKRSLK